MMGKKLSDMTRRELWLLFPVILTEHRDEWKNQYEEMESFLEEKLSFCQFLRISHIGSTAVHGIWAKPIVDILIEISKGDSMVRASEAIVNNGFIQMSKSGKQISFNCGYTENGFAEKVYHLHLRYIGDNDELYFRDYLNENFDIAKEYEQLKLGLWHQYEYDRDAYTKAKANFVKQYTIEAKRKYGNHDFR